LKVRNGHEGTATISAFDNIKFDHPRALVMKYDASKKKQNASTRSIQSKQTRKQKIEQKSAENANRNGINK
jgi:hypothetical protein